MCGAPHANVCGKQDTLAATPTPTHLRGAAAMAADVCSTLLWSVNSHCAPIDTALPSTEPSRLPASLQLAANSSSAGGVPWDRSCAVRCTSLQQVCRSPQAAAAPAAVSGGAGLLSGWVHHRLMHTRRLFTRV